MLVYLKRAVRWLLLRPGYRYLTAGDEALAGEPPPRYSRAWAGLMAQSLGWGLALCGVWGLAWAGFGGGSEPLVMPAAATLVFFVLGPFRQAALSGLEVLAGPRPWRPLLAAVMVAGLGMCFLRFSTGPYLQEFPVLPGWLKWVRPLPPLYRVLVLMPLWGAWSMLITPQYCRPGPKTEPATAAFARGCGPLRAVGCLLVPLAGAMFYFHYLGLRGQIVISALALLGAIASGLVCCWLAGGLCRRALLAANLLTQWAFLLACLGWR